MSWCCNTFCCYSIFEDFQWILEITPLIVPWGWLADTQSPPGSDIVTLLSGTLITSFSSELLPASNRLALHTKTQVSHPYFLPPQAHLCVPSTIWYYKPHIKTDFGDEEPEKLLKVLKVCFMSPYSKREGFVWSLTDLWSWAGLQVESQISVYRRRISVHLSKRKIGWAVVKACSTLQRWSQYAPRPSAATEVFMKTDPANLSSEK